MLRSAKALPPQVHIMSLYNDGSTAIFRLAHIYEVTRHACSDLLCYIQHASLSGLHDCSLIDSDALHLLSCIRLRSTSPAGMHAMTCALTTLHCLLVC